MKRKPSLWLTAALSMAASTAFASGSQDAYVASFETYAKEVQALQGDYSADNAIQTYAQEVAAVEKRAGYIGDELPIPKATKVMDGVYTVVGSFIWGTRENFGLLAAFRVRKTRKRKRL